MRMVDADVLKEAVDNGWKPDMMVSELWEIIDEAPTVSGWISVKDRLPEGKLNPYTRDYQEVICLLNTRFGCDVRTYEFGRGHFWHGPQEIDKYITHWMPMPEPPEEDKE